MAGVIHGVIAVGHDDNATGWCNCESGIAARSASGAVVPNDVMRVFGFDVPGQSHTASGVIRGAALDNGFGGSAHQLIRRVRRPISKEVQISQHVVGSGKKRASLTF